MPNLKMKNPTVDDIKVHYMQFMSGYRVTPLPDEQAEAIHRIIGEFVEGQVSVNFGRFRWYLRAGVVICYFKPF